MAHEIRRHCKKQQALLRLVRGSFPDHAREQRVVRDAGRELAALRDVAAHRDALARLRQRDAQRYAVPELERAEAWLAGVQQSDTVMRKEAVAVQRALDRLDRQRDRLSAWTLEKHGFCALSDGFAHTYRLGRQRLAQVIDEPTADNFHELRKYVKHHRFHLELLQSLWKRPIGAAVEEVELLGEWLGEHHDLHVLAIALGDESRGADRIDPVWLGELTRPEMSRLERRALGVARRVYAEKPSRMCTRFGVYWQACEQQEQQGSECTFTSSESAL
ncbi:CHAD domain-containing protein [Cognatiluteimonas profundi]|uniref:CHAD domain-containing protein n=1 Tax=Cognatiluteimonas profundi TaxID=2594501 RepID=UPI001E44BFC6|nr:CHAD domain-containing protein [Lysobacter profundi]